jgi:uncharacterized protein YacL
MTLTDIIKNSGYAVVFGFMGLIIGIWTADLLYRLILHNMERTTTSSIALIIIVLIIAAASVFGFTKGKKLLED